MIEKKFKDLTGFSEKNTFFQFDQWETTRLHGAKNRYVYDFSMPIIPGEPDDYLLNLKNPPNTVYTPFKDKILTNLATVDNNAAYGEPGFLAEYIGSLSTERTINADETTISVNEDTLMFINKGADYQLAEKVDYFRSGYIEFTIKTNKQNCIIASGSSQVDAKDLDALFWLFGAKMDQGVSLTSLFEGDTMSPLPVASENYPYYRADSFDGALINLNIKIIDGKLAIEYYDDYNRDNVNFLFIGNEIVADNNWHHIVVNFGRPGLIKTNGTKYNKKFIEIWVDGNLDKHFDDKVNEYQIFYPTVKWLFNSVKESVYNYLENEIDSENDMDVRAISPGVIFNSYGHGGGSWRTIGANELTSDRDLFVLSINTDFYKKNAFKGAIHTFAHGINIPISQYEIKRRLRLWKKQTKKFAKTININAEMKNPTISTNSKKALRLFWNNLVDNGKYGIQLDKNFEINTFSITHILNGSSSETLNNDIKLNEKEINVLANVRIVLTDNALINGPGTVLFNNTEEGFVNIGLDISKSALQTNPKGRGLDSVDAELNGFKRFVGPRTDLTFSGINLNNGDRILLTNQIKTEENGIWIFNGLDKYLTRAEDSFINSNVTNVVYVEEGYSSNTYWKANNGIESFVEPQKWSIINLSNVNNFSANFDIISRWKDYHGQDRFIDINSDLNISNYDLITFVNYPENNEQIFEMFPNDSKIEILQKYSNFIKSLENACAQGANLYVSSPKLAQDLGIVKNFEYIDQEIETGDAHSAAINPFEPNEPAERYFDTHRQNLYHLATEVSGLTDKETYILTDFINYTPSDVNNFEQYHAKYAYRQFGLQEGNEFIVPSLALRNIGNNENLPGFKANQRNIKSLAVINPADINTGTVVTKLSNTHYHGNDVVTNEYDDYATTIIVHNNQILNGQPISGKIFINCIEDGYTMSREEYNKAIIQVIPQNEINESTATRAWQYSTSRLNRSPRKINVRELTEFGQTTPTNGGGGPFIQAPTNSSNGIIRSESDRGNINYQSDLYTTEEEEIYPTQEIPVLSMTWLGLQWLAE
jgi:hypothetical protein